MTKSSQPQPRAELFGQLAVARGMITAEQLEQALARQRKLDQAGHHRLLGELLVGSGLLSTSQVGELLSLQSKRILSCPECFALFNAREYDPHKLYRCRRCREYLVPLLADTRDAPSNVEAMELDSGDDEDQRELGGRAVLQVETGSRAGSTVRLAEGETIRIGSQPELELVLDDPGVAPIHAKLRSSGLDVLLFDYGAEGGTRINGSAVDFLGLFAGDQIEIAGVRLQVRAWDDGADSRNDDDTATDVQIPSDLRKESLFGHELIEAGLASADQINEALAEQDRRRKAGDSVRMGELMVELGILSDSQVLAVLQKQKKHVMFCSGCKMAYNINERDRGKSFKCAGCGTLIDVPASESALTELDAAAKARIKLSTTQRKRGLRARLKEQEAKRRKPSRKPSGPQHAMTTHLDARRKLEITHDPERTIDIEPPPRPEEPTPVLIPEPGEEPFGELAVQLRYVTRSQLERTLQQQQELRERGEYAPPIGELLLENRYITPAQKQEILKRQGKRTSPIEIPGYHLLEKLGEGSTGSVFRAIKLKGRRPVALKIVRPELCKDERFIRRFYREAETAMRLSHPNVVCGVDAGQHGRYLYMAMEFVEGETAQAYLQREGRMSERYSIEIGYQISLALEYAGENNLIHRDVKPENILLARDGTAKLIDLGLAKLVSETQADGQIVGTPNYISPEQARGEQMVDIRSDIYSLGASLYHMVTGELPFHHPSPMETMLMHIRDDPIPPHQRAGEISETYSAVILRMMAKEPARRPQTWNEIAGELERMMAL